MLSGCRRRYHNRRRTHSSLNYFYRCSVQVHPSTRKLLFHTNIRKCHRGESGVSSGNLQIPGVVSCGRLSDEVGSGMLAGTTTRVSQDSAKVALHCLCIWKQSYLRFRCSFPKVTCIRIRASELLRLGRRGISNNMLSTSDQTALLHPPSI